MGRIRREPGRDKKRKQSGQIFRPHWKNKNAGAKGESNPRPLAPKARIIPLDHWPVQFWEKVRLEGFEPPTFGSGIRRAAIAP